MQTNKPKVSIIIPVYNREDYIGETINSVLNQDYENFEIILVDDASSDNSNAVMQKFADDEDRVILLKNTLNKGRSGSVNVGLEKANGDYITFLDSDDLFSEERLKKQVRFMQENSDVDMSYGNMVEFSEEGDEKNWDSIEPVDFFSLLKERSEMSFEELDVFPYVSAFIHKDAGTSKFKNEFIPASSVLLKKEVIKSGVKCDENLKNTEDYDMWLQVIGKGFKLRKINEVLFKYRKHAGQKSGNPEKMMIAKRYIINKLINKGYFN